MELGSIPVEMALAVFGPAIGALWFAWQKSRKDLALLHASAKKDLESAHEELDRARMTHMKDMRGMYSRIIQINDIAGQSDPGDESRTGTPVRSLHGFDDSRSRG